MSRGPVPDKARDRPTVPDVLPKVRAYYAAHPDNFCGGSLHVVFEDGNIKDGHIEWCREYAAGRDDDAGVELADLLLQMTGTQRARLASMSHYPE